MTLERIVEREINIIMIKRFSCMQCREYSFRLFYVAVCRRLSRCGGISPIISRKQSVFTYV